jgi:UDP-N-acetyl-2-amino-2-deoxyglucuronate dehydrogenase
MVAMAGKVGFALVGTGNIAAKHALAIKNSRNAKLVAVVSRDEKRAESFSKRFGCLPYTDYDAVLRREDVQAVDIVTCNHLHADLGTKAASAGKHVLVEKPIDISIEKAEKLVKVCKKEGVILSVVSQKRFDGAMQQLKSMIDSGALGGIFLGNVSVKWHRSQEYYDCADGWKKKKKYVGGGVLMHQAIHMIDVLMWLLGPVEYVTGKVATATHKIEVEDTVLAIIGFKSGALGMVEGTTSVMCSFPDRIEIHGEKGSVAIERKRFVTWNFRESQKFSYMESKLRSISPMKIGTIGSQIDDFSKAIKTGGKPLVTGEEGRNVLRVIEAVYESAATGKTVKLGGG